MFGRPAANPFDDIVAKATDENLTTENWELILDVCDQVNAKPDDGPRDAIAAVMKRLAHRMANVQLYALTLAESLSKNCGTKIHREIASRQFTQALLRLVNDRTTHNTVKARVIELVTQWAEEFKKDPSLSIMDETLRQLKSSNPNIQPPSRPQKHEITDADRKKEEEELQMALALSLQDTHISKPTASTSQPQPPYGGQKQPVYPQLGQQGPSQQLQPSPPVQKPQTTAATVSRVKALYDFQPSEPSELPFRRGDIISVLDSVYKDWWRGQLRGQTGIFPVNYVEILKEPTPDELIREAEEEAKILAEGRNIEKLLGLLANAEGGRGVEDDNLQALYNQTLAIRPRLVKLIEKYSMRKDELIALNEKFHKARHDYDVLMEASMSRYSRPAPAPSTNPFQPQPYGSPYTGPGARPQSSFGYAPNPSASPAPGPNYSGHSPTTYQPPQNQWDNYSQQKPWESPTATQAQPVQPPPAQNPWESGPAQYESQAPPSQAPGQWDNQHQQWQQDQPPSQSQLPSRYGRPEEIAGPYRTPSTDNTGQNQWSDEAPANQSQNHPSYNESAPFAPPPNVAPGAYNPPPPQSYYTGQSQSAPSKPDSRPGYYSPPPTETAPYAPPPPPSQAPPAIPLDQKPPYPVGRGKSPYSFDAPKPPATYNQGNDRWASLRELSGPTQDGAGWYNSQGNGEDKDEGKKPDGSSVGGYYAVNS